MRTPPIAAALVVAGWLAGHAAAQPVPWQDLSPGERQRAIENYQRYRGLPRDQQKRLDQRSRKFEEMPSQERQRLRQTYEEYQRMPPNQQKQLEQRYQQQRKKRDRR
jgi:succinate dehydrogenase/fumarate reductase flavoprotein subunit